MLRRQVSSFVLYFFRISVEILSFLWFWFSIKFHLHSITNSKMIRSRFFLSLFWWISTKFCSQIFVNFRVWFLRRSAVGWNCSLTRNQSDLWVPHVPALMVKLMLASFSFISEIDSLVEKKEMVKFYEFSYMYEFQEYFKSVGCWWFWMYFNSQFIWIVW